MMMFRGVESIFGKAFATAPATSRTLPSNVAGWGTRGSQRLLVASWRHFANSPVMHLYAACVAAFWLSVITKAENHGKTKLDRDLLEIVLCVAERDDT